MQWMRQEETAWDTKGPAYAVKMRGGLDAQGNLVALDYDARAADHNHVGYNEPDTVLIAQLTGSARRTPARGRASYAVGHVRHPESPHGRQRRRRCRSLWETPLRTGNLRDPDGPQVTFASESFIDELAAAAKADPVAFRLKLLEASTGDDSGLQARAVDRVPSRRRRRSSAGSRGRRRSRAAPARSLTGRGIAYAFRSQTVVARDRRGRGESAHRPRLGEAHRLRARLRPGRSIPRR